MSLLLRPLESPNEQGPTLSAFVLSRLNTTFRDSITRYYFISQKLNKQISINDPLSIHRRQLNVILHENYEKCQFYGMMKQLQLQKYKGIGSFYSLTQIKQVFKNAKIGGPIIQTKVNTAPKVEDLRQRKKQKLQQEENIAKQNYMSTKIENTNLFWQQVPNKYVGYYTLQNVKISSKIYWDIFLLISRDSLSNLTKEQQSKFGCAFDRMIEWHKRSQQMLRQQNENSQSKAKRQAE